MFAALSKLFITSWSILLDAGFWVIVSLIVGGFLHTSIAQDSFKKWFGSTSFRSIGLATAIGMVLPVCSCGVVPLGLSLYWSGASLAATLAFMVATPLINPAAALMALGLLGPELTTVYILSGLLIPLCLTYSSMAVLPDLQYAPGFSANSGVKVYKPLMPLSMHSPQSMPPAAPSFAPQGQGHPAPFAAPGEKCHCTCQSTQTSLASPGLQATLGSATHPSTGSFLFSQQLASALARTRTALRWGFLDLGLSVCKYIVYGIIFAAAVFTLIPSWVIPTYLGEPSVLSYGGSVLLGTAMYVCSVGHIPVVAAMIAMGASPGVAITFLLSGIATNLPELVALTRLIKWRVACLYALGLITTAVLAGIATNFYIDLVTGSAFQPLYVVDQESTVLTLASRLDVAPPRIVSQICALMVLSLGLYSIAQSWYKAFTRWFATQRGHHAQ